MRLVLAAGFIFAHVLAASQTRIRGVPPEGRPPYENARESGKFSCADGSTIEFAQINDDFCDCADGSDEPGTSACTQGRFFCANRGFERVLLPSSRVNDGVCDCCDGSDEEGAAPGSSCVNDCAVKGIAMRERIEQEIRTHREGAITKKAWAEQGKQVRAQKLEELADKLHALGELKDTVAELKMEKEALEKAVRIEDEERAKMEEREREEAANARLSAETVAVEDIAIENIDFEMERIEAELAQLNDGLEASSAAKPPADGAKKRERSKSKNEVALEELKELMEEKLAEQKKEEAAVAEAKALTDGNFGKDGEYVPLSTQCFSMQKGNYEFEVCPFRDAKQSEHGSVIATLGSFTSFDDGKMQFRNGQHCWNGPARSLDVHVICGTANEVLSVDEPSKCTYEMKFATPAACSEEVAEALQGNLDFTGEE